MCGREEGARAQYCRAECAHCRTSLRMQNVCCSLGKTSSDWNNWPWHWDPTSRACACGVVNGRCRMRRHDMFI